VTAAAGAQAPVRPASARGRDRRSLWQPARDRFPARPDVTDWPGAALPRAEALRQLARVLANGRSAGQRCARVGPGALLDWLEGQPGAAWQERWLASGADQAGTPGWRELPRRWLLDRGRPPAYWLSGMSVALRAAACADIVRPSMGWLLAGGAASNHFTRALAAERDPAGFARLQGLLDADPELSPVARRLTVHRAAVIVAAKGGTLSEVTVGDLLAEHAAEGEARRHPCQGMQVIYGALRAMGVISGPAAFRQLRAAGPRAPEQMIDRYHLACRPVRDLLVDYLCERQPALDHSTLTQLGYELGKLFWADIEQHHPGISAIDLPGDVARAWKQRLQVKDGSGGAAQAGTERISTRHCLTTVRAFYLDIAQWALDDPSRWARWAVPCPVRPQEITSRKDAQHRKSRMDARTRERLPVLPALAAAIDRQRKDAAALLAAARQAQPGQELTAAGRTLIRLPIQSGSPLKIWALDPATGERADLTVQESYAFWAWAAVEVLRHTGIRIEELLEISHHSLVQYRLPGTRELVPLLQVTPSKTDAERLLLVSPDLADVLAAVISRVRSPSGAIPLVAAYDRHERRWLPPAPLLSQRRFRGYDQALNDWAIREMLAAAITRAGIADPAAGQPLHYTPHDFRRMFITDAVLNGLPPHIAQVIAGHRDINVTMGYKAVYPDEAIQAHLAHLARRRALRPGEEYRAPTDADWQQFLGHFERRKVATGTCGRAFATPCAHEHACIRCPMLWPDPAQEHRLTEIRDNLTARITEAEREGWLGEMEGLKISLAGAQDKLAQISRRTNRAIDLGIPATLTR
jgi:integrase